MKRIIFIILLALTFQNSLSQKNPSASYPDKPKLVVGIVIDQMRYDFLWRYWNLYGQGGFKRLVNDGFLCEDAQYNYFLPTTAPGHSTIYTGTIPAVHGIVDNYWYERNLKQTIYVATDSSVTTVGNTTPAPSASPFRLMASTITDELKLADKNSKVIGIAQKDRAAIMPAGHLADGAFWFDTKTGNWITSTWYMKQIPSWLEQFNALHKADTYLANDWSLLLPRNQYTASTGDSMSFENPLTGELLPVFPH